MFEQFCAFIVYKANYSGLSWSNNHRKLMHICWDRLKGVACVLVIIVRGKTSWKLEDIRKAINTGQRALVQKYCLGTLLIVQSLGLVSVTIAWVNKKCNPCSSEELQRKG